MKITEINGKIVKIGKTSITVKDERGKTCGIVKNIKSSSVLSPRDKFDFHQKTGLGINFIKKCINSDGQWYYLHNIVKTQELEKSVSRWEGTNVDVSSDKISLAKMQEDRKIASEKLVVIDCYII